MKRLTMLALFIAPCLLAGDTERDELRLFMQGDYLFQKNCATCHGSRGRGNGELAEGVATKPRNFRKGIFKYRSTPMGFLPTDEDLARTIRGGVSGTMMPSFAHLPDSDVLALVNYLKSLSPRWRDPQYQAKPRPLPEPPEWLKDPKQLAIHIENGQRSFSITCIACHGESANGDGPAAEQLVDVWGDPIRPADLTQANRRSGPKRSDLFRTLAMGLDGTPMPGYLESLGSEKVWELVAYLESLPKAPLE